MAHFSPDGNQVAFEWSGQRDDNADIHVKLVDSPELRWLTSGPQADTAPQLDDVSCRDHIVAQGRAGR